MCHCPAYPYSSTSALNYADMESVHTDMKESIIMEDKRMYKAQREPTCGSPQKPIPLMSLLLWHKIVAICCFVWSLGLQLWSVGE